MDKGSAQSNSKFMDLKYFWIKEQLDKGLLLVYLDTDRFLRKSSQWLILIDNHG